MTSLTGLVLGVYYCLFGLLAIVVEVKEFAAITRYFGRVLGYGGMGRRAAGGGSVMDSMNNRGATRG